MLAIGVASCRCIGSIQASGATSKATSQSGSHGKLVFGRGRCRTQAELGPQLISLVGSTGLGADRATLEVESMAGGASCSRRVVGLLTTPGLILNVLVLTLCLSNQLGLVLLVVEVLRLEGDEK